MNPYLSVIIPAYNEEKRITKTLQAIYQYLGKQRYDWEMIIVLDGAQDDTLGKVRGFANGKKCIRWIDRRENKGKGYTVREGMLAARGKIRLFTDADNSTDISHFDKMRPFLQNGADIVICSRDGKDVAGARQAVPQSFFKRMLGNLGNLYIQIVAVPGIWDTQCGFKAFTAEAAKKIFPLCRLDRWSFDIEVLALARHFGFEIAIIPADWVDAPGTHVKFSDYFFTLRDTFIVRWNLTSGIYNHRPNAVSDVDLP